MRPRLGFSAFGTAVILSVVSTRAAAMAAFGDDSQKPVTFKSQTSMVQVPAIVVDKDGKHLHGLTQSDFRVFENGIEQKIANVQEVTPISLPAQVATLPNTYTNVLFDSDQPCRLTVLVLDAINTPYSDQETGRENLVKYLSQNLNTKQSVALMQITDKGIRRLSGITDDPGALLTILKNVKGDTPDTEAFAVSPERFTSGPERLHLEQLAAQTEAQTRQEQAIERTMRAFLAIAWSVSGVPGRKSLIWATGSFPFYIEAGSPEPDNPLLALLYERTMEALNDAQISVYPIDVRGLVADSAGSGPPPIHDLLNNTVGSQNWGGATIDAKSARNQLLDSTLHNLQVFADMTGGRAFYNRNDLSTGFQQAIDDSSSYYVLGYYRNSKDKKPGWRKLDVKLNREGSQVRARSGFFVGKTTLNPESTQQADENFALMSPFDSTGVPLMVRWNDATPNSGKDRRREFAMIVPASNVVQAADSNRVNVDFIWEATKNGSSVVKDGHNLKGDVNTEGLARLKREGVYYKNSLKLPPGEYQVKFVVRDNLSGRVGSITTPLSIQ